MSPKATAAWYWSYGWQQFNHWLVELAARNQKRVWIENFEFIPQSVDRKALAKCVNEDTKNWIVTVEDGELVCCAK